MLQLQELAKHGQQTKELVIHERLPHFISAPCVLHVSYHVDAEDDFYLLHLQVSGSLMVMCQRCMQEFVQPYDNVTVIAVARSDARAEQLLAHYECIVSSNWQVDLETIVVDELYLYAPQFHEEIDACDQEINQYLTRKNDAH